MKAKDLYTAGSLADAIDAAVEEVKKAPTDVGLRGFLCELFCFSGDLERADKQLDAMGVQDPEATVAISLFRHLVRAEQARQQFFAEGRVPDLIDKPSERIQLHLQASIRLREGQPAEAAELLQKAEEERAPVGGVCNGEPFDDLRDLDDLTSSIFEVLTSTGKYYWIPIERVELVEFHKPERPRDLLWRRAHMVVRGGPDGEVYLPMLYPGSDAESDDRVRLGRFTDWRSGDGGPVRGVGQRMFLAGDKERTVLELEEITIDNPMPGDDDVEDSA